EQNPGESPLVCPRTGRSPNENGISVTFSSRFQFVAAFCGGLFSVSLAALRTSIGEYSSLIFLGRQQSGDDDVLRGAISYANLGLIEKLEEAYSKIAVKPREIIEKKDSGVSMFSREFRNAAWEQTRSINVNTLITNTLSGALFNSLDGWRRNQFLKLVG
ncbi:MAG: hypothetical protein HZB40_18660, partial [Rhodocyclales bacterium]|nr:hypothetical protein [Rhodocyclales bacterium]